MKSAREQEPKK